MLWPARLPLARSASRAYCFSRVLPLARAAFHALCLSRALPPAHSVSSAFCLSLIMPLARYASCSLCLLLVLPLARFASTYTSYLFTEQCSDISNLQHSKGEGNYGDQLRFLEGGFCSGQSLCQQSLENRKEAVLVEMRQNVLTQLVHVGAKSFAARLWENQPHV